MPVIIPSHGLARIDYNGLWRHPRRLGILHVLSLECKFISFRASWQTIIVAMMQICRANGICSFMCNMLDTDKDWMG